MSEIIGSDNKKLLIKDNKKYVVISREDFTKIDEYIDAGYDNKSKLIPVRKVVGVDDWYGFIDKCGNESVPLIYDYVWNFDNSGYAKVKRFGHISIVDTKGNLYDTNNSSNVDAVSMLSKDETKKKGFFFNFGEYWPIKDNNKWGIARHKTIMGEKGIYKKISDIEVLYECDRILYIGYDVFGVFDYIIYKKNNHCILSHSISKEEHYFDVDSIEPIFEFETEEYPNRHVNFLLFRKNHKYGVVDIDGNIIISAIFDVLIPNLIYDHAAREDYESNTINSYIVFINNKCGIISHTGELLLPIEYDKIEVTIAQKNFKTGDHAVVWKNGKCSVICISTGKLLFPFIYEEIIANETYHEDLRIFSMDSTLLVKKDGKYGCVSLDKKQIIDIKYDKIIFDCWCIEDRFRYSLILQNNGKYGTYEYYEEDNGKRSSFYVEPQFDECIFLWNQHSELSNYRLHFIAVRSEGRWGIIDKNTDNNCPNLEDLVFRYKSLDELKQNANEEFKRICK